MCNVSHEFENKFDTTIEEYIFLQKSLIRAEIIFIQGDEYIALALAKHVCECQHYEVTYSMINDIWARCIDFKPENRDIIFLNGNVNISRELLQTMREQMGQDKIRWILLEGVRYPMEWVRWLLLKLDRSIGVVYPEKMVLGLKY